MALLDIPLERIDQSILQELLIDPKTAEGLTIEYKRICPDTSDNAKAQFLADIVSFANSRGGDLLIGIEAPGGIPTSFAAFTGDPEGERIRLEQIARSGLDPRISNLQTKAVPITSGGWVLIVRVPRSCGSPHRVLFRGRNQFWVRSSAMRYEPDVNELRILFARSPLLPHSRSGFWLDRFAEITAGENSVPVLEIVDLLGHATEYHTQDRLLPSAILATGVFEDVLRRICRINGMIDKDMKSDTLISALQRHGVIKSVVAQRCRAAASARNKALHAQWDEITLRDVEMVITLTRELLTDHFR